MNREESIEFAKEFLEDLLSFFGVNVLTDVVVDGDVIEISVPAIEESSLLIGRNAETLRSFQYMVSTALRNKNAELVRVNIDIAGYKQQRAEKLAEKAHGWIEEVRKTGDSRVESLNAADRRIVHKVAQEYDDIETFSEGFGRDRKIIIAQKSS
jgi:spoIIIJ-associated protein